MQKFDSVIFDLDGTLWDAVDSVVLIWNRVLSDVGLEPCMDYEKLSSCMGLRINDIIDKLLPQATKEQKNIIIRECVGREQNILSELGGTLYDGVEETLAKLSQKYKLFLVSNCQDGYINAFYSAHGLKKYFSDYECAGRTGMDKGDNIKRVMSLHNLKSPVYVGDTAADYEATVKADIPFIYAAYGFGKVTDCPVVIEDFSQLQNILL